MHASGSLPSAGDTRERDSRQQLHESRILIADASSEIREYIRELLAGYDVVVVADGEAAVRSARARRPDLILTDITMPGINSPNLMRELRADPDLSHVPVILLSARTGEESRIEGLEAGADECLVKPLSARELLASVRAQLRLARSRRQSREALRASEARYRALVTTSSDVVFQMSGDWTVMNPIDGRNLVASSNTPIRGWMEQNLPEFEHARVRAAIDEAITRKRTFELEHQVVRADGSLGWTLSRAVPILDDAGDIIEWFGTASDITDRKLAQAALERVTSESERTHRLYETVLSATPDFVYVFSLDHRVLYANESLIRMWGRGREGAIGKTFLEIGYEPWHAEMHDREIDQVRATKQPIRGEVPFTGTSGRRIYDYIFVPVIGTDGEVEAVAGTTRDVTDRKESELALAESDRKKDEFIALLAHELRNPLAPIRNGLQIVRQARELAVRERAQAMMDRQLAHMVRLIDDLLDVSRISRNKLELRRTPVTLSEVVESAVEAAQPAVEAAGHELSVTLPARPVHLNADLTRLAQVLSNLLMNSAKYTERAGKIWLSAERGEGVIEVTVIDTGIGIPPESLSGIFDMFSQVDRGIERASGGLGIGLALVKGLTEMHGGAVVARSDGEGRGSTFVVTLPIIPDELLAARDPFSSPLPASSPRRVLVVDDHRDGAESLGTMLELAGHEVTLAHDGFAAIERAAEFRPDVILMDVGMPRLNGLDATRLIRQEPWGQSTTIIAVTGWGQECDREQSREAGCNGHLVKPVSLEELKKILAGLP
jgi:PAS domain S-box-containing protein